MKILMTLDLHGVTHDMVPKLVHSFIHRNLDHLPVEIVTGKSDTMRGLVIDVIKEYQLHHHNQGWTNSGCIVVTDEESI